MAKLTARCEIGTAYIRFTATLDAEVDSDKPDGMKATAARLFVQVQDAAETALEKYRVESAGATEAQVREDRGKAGAETPAPLRTELAKCVDCCKPIFSAQVMEYSRRDFGKSVCYVCQELRRKAATPAGSGKNTF
ncbi:MAG TPA: hypothetical protein VM487_18115 [Phycisphaerae bacterium]|nr:hypothetical protein [Phycisphaerae bacterium]